VIGRGAQLTFDGYRAARLAAQAYADGYAHGADPERAGRRDVVGATAADDWRRGFEAGRQAADEAERAYREAQLRRGVARRPAVRW